MTRAADDGPDHIQAAGTRWLQVRVAAEELDITPQRIYHLIDDKRLRTRSHLGLLYVHQGDVHRYKEYQRQLHHLQTKLAPL